MTRFNRFVADAPWVSIVMFIAVTVLFAWRIPSIHIETDLLAFMPKNHPVFKFNTWAEDYFNIDEPALVGVVNRGPDGIFTPDTLALIQHLSDEMMALPIVDADDLVSLTEVDNITGDEYSLTVDPFYEDAPTTPEGARLIRDAVFDSELIVGALVSEDGQATLIIAETLEGVDKVETYQALRAIVAAAPVGDEEIFIAGRPVIEGEMTVLARADLKQMFPLVILASGIILWVTLRSLRAVFLPILVVVTAVVWALGLMGWARADFFSIHSMMPTLLIAVGVADGIHVIHHFLLSVAAAPDRSRSDLVFDTMQVMARPVILTSLTTAAGFLSLAASPMRPIQGLGTYTAFGVIAAMVFSLTILPGLLVVLPLPSKAAARVARARTGGEGPVARALDTLTPLVLRYPRRVMALGIAMVVLGVSGWTRIVVDGSLLQNFPETNQVKRSDAHILEHFGGTNPLQIVLEAEENNAWKEPAMLRAVEQLQDHLEAGGYVGQTRSITDLIKRMNEVLNPEDPQAYRVPDSADAVAQYLLLYSMSGEPDDFDDVVDYDYRMVNVRAQVNSDHSPVLARVLDDVEAYAAEHLAPLGIRTRLAGAAKTSATFMSLIITGQIRSLALAILLVGILTGLMSRAPAAGLLCIIPVSVASILSFGALGWLDVPLGVATALISSISIGIGIDYAIHFVVKYQRTRQGGATPEETMHATMGTSGVAIFYNAIVVFVGFLVLATSAFPPNRSLGFMVAFNMIVCFIGTVTTLAAALHLMQPAFVRPAASADEPAVPAPAG